MSFFEKLKQGMTKTRKNIAEKLSGVFSMFTRVDEDLLEELEETLILCDVGVNTAMRVIGTLRERIKAEKIREVDGVKAALKEILLEQVQFSQVEETFPRVILVVGVNGAGKTTSIGKIAHVYTEQGKKVLLAAADTFRAAAIDQIAIWADRVGVGLIRHEEGSDPASVVYDAAIAAKNQHADVLIVDTAGRLHNKKNLMDELAKIDRVLTRELPGADRETLLVLDATTGQNAVIQAKAFKEAAKLTGLILTKMDGTAKGGIVFSIRRELGIPVKFIGVGEQAEDLQPFSAQDFVKALFEGEHAAAKEEGETE